MAPTPTSARAASTLGARSMTSCRRPVIVSSSRIALARAKGARSANARSLTAGCGGVAGRGPPSMASTS